MHSQFEELCALAATGQISGDAIQLLDEHAKQCDQCRTFLQEIGPVIHHIGPVLAATDVCDCEPPDGMRDRFLRRASAAGLTLKPGSVLASSKGARSVPTPLSKTNARGGWLSMVDRMRAWHSASVRLAVPAAAAVLCGFVGYFIAQARLGAPSLQVTVPSPAVLTTVAPKSATSADAATKLGSKQTEAQHASDRVVAELGKLKAEKQQLLARLAETAQRVSAGDQFQQQFQADARKLQDAQDRIASLQAQLAAEQSEQATTTAALIEQQKVAEDANAKIARLQAELDRERQVKVAKSEAGEMIAARNLHIVDVYDTESNGELERPFGRVFYVEGRSLVFYAYDLPQGKHASAQVAFHVWGETASVKNTTYNLGIMENDVSGQSRWKLTFNDPRVLNRINAVYITVEPGTNSKPEGRKLMYAFLGSPNHP
jgi:hypothetical protein